MESGGRFYVGALGKKLASFVRSCDAKKKKILSSDGSDSDGKKCKGYGWVDESGVWRSVLCWCAWQETCFSLNGHIFTFNVVHKDIL
jgi:hypothetical protein